jgi:hypothetical protein
MWMSWPQACMTGIDCPLAFFTTTVLANSSPVFSSTGSASSSVRNMTVGPAPFFITATIPVRPTPVATSNPSALIRAASLRLSASPGTELGIAVEVSRALRCPGKSASTSASVGVVRLVAPVCANSPAEATTR